MLVRLKNGVGVELVALTRYDGGAVKWWAPDGSPLAVPGVAPADLKHKGLLMAVRLLGPISQCRPRYLLGPALHPMKEFWPAGDKGLYLGVLGYADDRLYGKLHFNAAGGPWKELYRIPLTAADIGEPVRVNDFGIDTVALTSDGKSGRLVVEVECKSPNPLKGQRFAAIDAQGRGHPPAGRKVYPSLTRLDFDLPAPELRGLARQEQSWAAAWFVNVSLQGQPARVLARTGLGRGATPPMAGKVPPPAVVAKLPNGVRVELIAVGRLEDHAATDRMARMRWWTPQGKPADVPDVPAYYLEGQGLVLAMRIQNSGGAMVFHPRDGKLRRIDGAQYAASHGLWLFPLQPAGGKDTATVVLRSDAEKGPVVLEVPLTAKDLGRTKPIGKHGYDRIEDFRRPTASTIALRVRHGRQRTFGDWVAVDVDGKEYECVSAGFYGRFSECTFPVPPERLAKLILRASSPAEVRFDGISLAPGRRSEVQTAVRTVDRTIPPDTPAPPPAPAPPATKPAKEAQEESAPKPPADKKKPPATRAGKDISTVTYDVRDALAEAPPPEPSEMGFHAPRQKRPPPRPEPASTAAVANIIRAKVDPDSWPMDS